jgi:septal ring-binding cell division protein DamX
VDQSYRIRKLDLTLHLVANLNTTVVLKAASRPDTTELLRHLQANALPNWLPCYVKASANLDLALVMEELLKVARRPATDRSDDAAALLEEVLVSLGRQNKYLVLMLDHAGVLMPGMLAAISQYARLHPQLKVVYALKTDEMAGKMTTDALALVDAQIVSIAPESGVVPDDAAPTEIPPIVAPKPPRIATKPSREPIRVRSGFWLALAVTVAGAATWWVWQSGILQPSPVTEISALPPTASVVEPVKPTQELPVEANEVEMKNPTQEPAAHGRTLFPSPSGRRWPEGPDEGERPLGSRAQSGGHGAEWSLPAGEGLNSSLPLAVDTPIPLPKAAEPARSAPATDDSKTALTPPETIVPAANDMGPVQPSPPDSAATPPENLKVGTLSPPLPEATAPTVKPLLPEPVAKTRPNTMADLKNSEWLLQQSPKAYTLQLVTVSQLGNVGSLVRRMPPSNDISMYESVRPTGNLHFVLYGLYPNLAAANAAASELTGANQGRPVPRTLKSIQDEIRRNH